MRFLCKKCGAESPGDISEVAIREGALVFVCKTCGASATLVENRAKGVAGSTAGEKPAEKGIVEPDEDELVDLGEATLSRMLGKKVRIVAAIEDVSSIPESPNVTDVGTDSSAVTEPPPPVPATTPVTASVVALEAPAGGTPAPALAVEERLVPAFALEPEAPRRGRRSRVSLAIAAGVVLLAVATVALLEARPQRAPAGDVPGSATPAGPDPLPVKASADGAPASAPPEAAPAATPSATPGDSAREVATAEEPAGRIKVQELGTPVPSPSVPVVGGGGIPAEQVDAAFFRVRPGVRMCAVQEQRRNPDVKLGSEAVTLTVAPTGEVTRIDFENHGLAGTPLGACLAQELGKFHVGAFPGPPAAVRSVLELARPGSPTN